MRDEVAAETTSSGTDARPESVPIALSIATADDEDIRSPAGRREPRSLPQALRLLSSHAVWTVGRQNMTLDQVSRSSRNPDQEITQSFNVCPHFSSIIITTTPTCHQQGRTYRRQIIFCCCRQLRAPSRSRGGRRRLQRSLQWWRNRATTVARQGHLAILGPETSTSCPGRRPLSIPPEPAV